MKNEIDPLFEDGVNISKIGPEGKFITDEMFKEWHESERGYGLIRITHDDLKCEKLNENDRLIAACNMFEALQKHIESEMEKEFEKTQEHLIKLKELIDYTIRKEKKRIRDLIRLKYPSNPLVTTPYIKPNS